ncbi:hypothetical protein HYH03_005247 [Edaphochlamys debaryana]|uniref:Nucleotide-diphospho-sugar transferase domain-containing protein n=1 Tax=Edaphochlamys debaryana TaxID=47281 RepID=A0A836C2I5_9CHLO|nr:hypothetical protein HYH03_005247 [Edaphochlamys debaryana]|eukprot:KAG2496842.1 hypothetical protein HYH03_005247 [Edaphochlamys debaryana]
MSGDASLLDVEPVFLKTLQNIVITLPDNRITNLARVHMIHPLSTSAMGLCRKLQDQYGNGCAPGFENTFPAVQESQANSSHMAFLSGGFFVVGYAKMGIMINLLSLGYDVLFVDSDHVYFRNPIPAFYTSYKADLYTALEHCRNLDTQDGVVQFPDKVVPNISTLFARATGAVMRCLMNWFFAMISCAGKNEWCWDQYKFKGSMELCMRGMSYNHFTLGFLSPEKFASLCHGTCGCDALGMPRVVWRGGRGDPAYEETCPARVVKKWWLFHVACFAGHMDGSKVKHMQRALRLYEKHVGPQGSAPQDPMPWWTADPWWLNFTAAG